MKRLMPNFRTKQKEGMDDQALSGQLRKELVHNDAEIAGLFLAAMSEWKELPETGSPQWAVQGEILSRYDSREALSSDALEGLVANLKGHAFERWLGHHGEMLEHSSPNFPGSDGIDPNTGELVEAKAGSPEYIKLQRERYPADVDMHSTNEGGAIPGVTAHDISEKELSDALLEVNSDGVLVEILGGSVAFGAVLSTGDALAKVRSGEIELADVPKKAAVDVAGRSARIFLIGTAVTSGSPVFVAAGAGWAAYNNRTALAGFYRVMRSAFANRTTRNFASATGRVSWRTTRWAGSTLYAGVTHPSSRKFAGKATKGLAKGTWWGVKSSARGGLRGIVGLGRFAFRRSKK